MRDNDQQPFRLKGNDDSGLSLTSKITEDRSLTPIKKTRNDLDEDPNVNNRFQVAQAVKNLITLAACQIISCIIIVVYAESEIDFVIQIQ